MAKKSKQHPLVYKIKNNKEQTAYKYFENEVEIDEAESLIVALETLGDDETAETIKSFIRLYNGDSIDPEDYEEEEEEVETAPVKQAEPYKPYHDNSGLGYIDWYADAVEFEFDPLTMVSSRFRVPRGSSNEVRAKYLNKLWHEAIDLARENDDQNWFTRIIRHQISALIKGDARTKFLKGIPLPRHA